MFERLTDRGQKVMDQAAQEAKRLDHSFIGTEHILLSILKQESGAGAHALQKLGVDPSKVRLAVEQLMNGEAPNSPRPNNVIGLAIQEARIFKHNYVGTEHLLLGILREGQGTGYMALEQLGVSLDGLRRCIIEMYADGPRTDHAVAGGPFELPRQLSFFPAPERRAYLVNERGKRVSGLMGIELAAEIVKCYNARSPSTGG